MDVLKYSIIPFLPAETIKSIIRDEKLANRPEIFCRTAEIISWAFLWAARKGRVDRLIGLDEKYKYTIPAAVRSDALRQAASRSRLDAVRYLLQTGGSVEFENYSAVRWAARNCQYDVCLLLLQEESKGMKEIALADVAAHNCLGAVEFLLGLGANPAPEKGNALLWAAKNGHQGIVGRLLKAGAVPTEKIRQDADPHVRFLF